MARDDLIERINTVEECYEFMLAYAAQGLDAEGARRSGGELRDYLERAEGALGGLADLVAAVVEGDGAELAEQFRAFNEVLDRDARSTLAAIRLVLAQPAISSQLIDNLNASIHLRALLTDLFLIDELLKLGVGESSPPARSGPV